MASIVPDFLMASPEGSKPSDMVFSTCSELVYRMKKRLSSILPEYLPESLGGFPAPPTPSGFLKVTDSRTGDHYEIPIRRNAVEATQFKQIRARADSKAKTDKNEGGLRLLDPGYQNTAVASSEVTFVDGTEGSIHYRQYDISELVGTKQFEDVTYLLIWGKLPSPEEKEMFKKQLALAMHPPQMVSDVIHAFPSNTPIVTMMIAGLSAWTGSDPTVIPAYMGKNIYQGHLDLVDSQIIRLISALATVIAMSFCRMQEKPFTPADLNGSFIENTLRMMGFVEDETKKPNPKHVECLEKLWVLYADHELTNSTAAFLHVASTLADPFSCTIASLTAAYGPLHGGAIDTAFKVIQNVGKPENVPQLIDDVKAKKCRLFGYGHRIYKTVDPRSVIIRELLDELKDEDAAHKEFLATALEIDRIASEDQYFTSRHLKANADLYGSFVYMALGFPPEIILPLAMMSRCPGVMAHWREAMNGNPRLWRPQQIYTGAYH